MYFGPEMFVPLTDPARQRELFKATVNRIEVETHSYCNRRCDYCPNVVGDRLGPNVRMKAAIWEKLLSGLAEVGFDQAFVLNSYNEPLYDRDILTRIAEARAAMPKAQLMIYTNGDYLTPEYVDELAAAGLSYLHISIHLKRGEEFTDLYVLNRIAEVAHRMNRQARFRQVRAGSAIIADFDHPGMKIETRAINFSVHGNDRGVCCPTCRRPSRGRTPAPSSSRISTWAIPAMSCPAATSAATGPNMPRMWWATWTGRRRSSTSSSGRRRRPGGVGWCMTG